VITFCFGSIDCCTSGGTQVGFDALIASRSSAFCLCSALEGDDRSPAAGAHAALPVKGLETKSSARLRCRDDVGFVAAAGQRMT
jgi:hypothetical protein